ncbi:MAG TPA: ankyrin repeat domain-containing protein [Dongiaceae bacterium]
MVFKPVLAAVCLALCAAGVAQAGPLHDAAQAGDLAQIEKLLAEGADINESNGLATPLYFAISGKHAEEAQLLIERGADVNAQSIWGAPLHAAAAKGMTATVNLLLERGADPNGRWQGLTPLHIAARNDRIEVARALLDHGADINALSQLDEPALHFALIFDHADVTALLRERGAQAPRAEDIAPLLGSADPAHGAEVALACRGCHSVDREAEIKNGPPLWDIVGRPKASIDGFKYSVALKALGGDWSYAELNQYIAHPAFTVPGVAMKTAGIHDAKGRADLIAFLRSLSDHPAPLP